MSYNFNLLLASNMESRSIYKGLNPNVLDLKRVQMGGFGEDLNSGSNVDSGQTHR